MEQAVNKLLKKMHFCSLTTNFLNRSQERWTDAQAFHRVGTLELHLSGLIGTASHSDMQKIG